MILMPPRFGRRCSSHAWWQGQRIECDLITGHEEPHAVEVGQGRLRLLVTWERDGQRATTLEEGRP